MSEQNSKFEKNWSEAEKVMEQIAWRNNKIVGDLDEGENKKCRTMTWAKKVWGIQILTKIRRQIRKDLAAVVEA